MIDVIMVLIVFYLVVGKLAADQRSNIRLPQSATGLTEKAQERLVHQHPSRRGGHRRGRHSGRLARIHNQGAARRPAGRDRRAPRRS